LEIHPPEHPIRSFRDFAVQIFTVTCGIIIALGLEARVVHRHEARLLRETRAQFSAEIRDSIDKLQSVHALADRDIKWMRDMLDWGALRLKHKPAKPPDFLDARSFTVLPDEAWTTAEATQALPLMRFTELRALAKVHTYATAFNDVSARGREQWLGVIRYGDLESLTDDEIRTGLGDLRVTLAYTMSLKAYEEKLIKQYQDAEKEVQNAE
jgi:hypothetical protein